jgi:hypothetical protein
LTRPASPDHTVRHEAVRHHLVRGGPPSSRVYSGWWHEQPARLASRQDTFQTAWAYGSKATDGLVSQSVLTEKLALHRMPFRHRISLRIGKPLGAVQQLASSRIGVWQPPCGRLPRHTISLHERAASRLGRPGLPGPVLRRPASWNLPRMATPLSRNPPTRGGSRQTHRRQERQGLPAPAGWSFGQAVRIYAR